MSVGTLRYATSDEVIYGEVESKKKKTTTGNRMLRILEKETVMNQSDLQS